MQVITLIHNDDREIHIATRFTRIGILRQLGVLLANDTPWLKLVGLLDGWLINNEGYKNTAIYAYPSVALHPDERDTVDLRWEIGAELYRLGEIRDMFCIVPRGHYD